MGGGGRTVERLWRFREIKRTLNKKEKRIKQLLATTSAKKRSISFINRKEEKDVDWLKVLMTFKLCQTSQGLEPTILRSVPLPCYPTMGLPSILACVAGDFFGRARN